MQSLSSWLMSDEKHWGCCKDPKAISSILSDYTLPLGVQGVLGEWNASSYFSILLWHFLFWRKQTTPPPPTSYQVSIVSTRGQDWWMSTLCRLSWGHLWAAGVHVCRLGLGQARLKVWGHSHRVQHIDLCLPKSTGAACKLGRAAVVPEPPDITDLASVSVYRASGHPWNKDHTIWRWDLCRISLLILQKAKLTHCSLQHM